MSIFDEIGGASAVRAAVDAFYDRVLADQQLAPFFEGVDVARLKGHQRSFIAAAIGGPASYLGRAMAEAHAHLGITAAAFAAVVGHLIGALTELGVPASTISAIVQAIAPLEVEVVTG
jgi:hemoglobin